MLIKLQDYKDQKIAKELKNIFTRLDTSLRILCATLLRKSSARNLKIKLHKYTREEVQEANNHPFVKAMNLKLEYNHSGILVDKKWKKPSTDMRKKDKWMLILKPEGYDIIEDLKKEIKNWELKIS